MSFKACLIKDIKEQLRSKKFYVYLAMSVGIALFAVLIIAIMAPLSNFNMGDESLNEMIKALFEPTYFNSLNYFMSFMLSYFLLVVIIMIRNSFSKEMKNNTYVLPIFSGIKTETIILSKIIVNTLSIVICYCIAAIVHFLLTIAFFTPDIVSIYNLLFSYFCFLLALIFFVVLTLCVDALTQNGAISCAINIIILILGTSILESVFIGKTALIQYTPLAFYSLAITTSFADINILAIIIASITYLLLIGGLLFLTIKKSRVKAEK